MIINNFKYVKLALLLPYVIISVWGGYIYFLYQNPDPSVMALPFVSLLLMFKKILGLGEMIIKKELYRRIAKLPVSKFDVMNWNINKNVGISFVDFERNTFWFCGSQTDFEIHILSMNNIIRKEYSDRIVYMDVTDNRSYAVYRYTN